MGRKVKRIGNDPVVIETIAQQLRQREYKDALTTDSINRIVDVLVSGNLVKGISNPLGINNDGRRKGVTKTVRLMVQRIMSRLDGTPGSARKKSDGSDGSIDVDVGNSMHSSTDVEKPSSESPLITRRHKPVPLIISDEDDAEREHQYETKDNLSNFDDPLNTGTGKPCASRNYDSFQEPRLKQSSCASSSTGSTCSSYSKDVSDDSIDDDVGNSIHSCTDVETTSPESPLITRRPKPVPLIISDKDESEYELQDEVKDNLSDLDDTLDTGTGKPCASRNYDSFQEPRLKRSSCARSPAGSTCSSDRTDDSDDSVDVDFGKPSARGNHSAAHETRLKQSPCASRATKCTLSSCSTDDSNDSADTGIGKPSQRRNHSALLESRRKRPSSASTSAASTYSSCCTSDSDEETAVSCFEEADSECEENRDIEERALKGRFDQQKSRVLTHFTIEGMQLFMDNDLRRARLRKELILHGHYCRLGFRNLNRHVKYKSFTEYGYCRDRKCCRTYRFNVNLIANAQFTRVVVFYCGPPLVKHGSIAPNQLRGKERTAAAATLMNTPASNFNTKAILYDINKEAARDGNMQNVYSLHVLRKARSEALAKGDYHVDPYFDIILRANYDILKGYVQNPTGTTSYYLWKDDHIATALSSHRKVVLNFDSTGGPVKRCKYDTTDAIYYYAGVVQCENKTVPVLEMVSCEHDATSIACFLMKYKHHLEHTEGLPSSPFSDIVVDRSPAMISAVARGWFGVSVQQYLANCYTLMSNGVGERLPVRLRVCCSHMMKAISMKLKKLCKHMDKRLQKKVRHFYCVIMASLIDCSEWKEFKSLFNATVYIACSPRLSDLTESAHNVIRTHSNKIANMEDDFRFREDGDESSTVIQASSKVIDEHTRVMKDSPYYIECSSLLADAKETISGDDSATDEENKYYLPKFVDYLLENHVGEAPLWSGVAVPIPDKNKPARLSNCYVEAWFNLVKSGVLNRRKKQKAGRFLHALYEKISATIDEINLIRDQEKARKEHESLNKKSKKRGQQRYGISTDDGVPEEYVDLLDRSIATKRQRLLTSQKENNINKPANAKKCRRNDASLNEGESEYDDILPGKSVGIKGQGLLASHKKKRHNKSKPANSTKSKRSYFSLDEGGSDCYDALQKKPKAIKSQQRTTSQNNEHDHRSIRTSNRKRKASVASVDNGRQDFDVAFANKRKGRKGQQQRSSQWKDEPSMSSPTRNVNEGLKTTNTKRTKRVRRKRAEQFDDPHQKEMWKDKKTKRNRLKSAYFNTKLKDKVLQESRNNLRKDLSNTEVDRPTVHVDKIDKNKKDHVGNSEVGDLPVSPVVSPDISSMMFGNRENLESPQSKRNPCGILSSSHEEGSTKSSYDDVPIMFRPTINISKRKVDMGSSSSYSPTSDFDIGECTGTLPKPAVHENQPCKNENKGDVHWKSKPHRENEDETDSESEHVEGHCKQSSAPDESTSTGQPADRSSLTKSWNQSSTSYVVSDAVLDSLLPTYIDQLMYLCSTSLKGNDAAVTYTPRIGDSLEIVDEADISTLITMYQMKKFKINKRRQIQSSRTGRKWEEHVNRRWLTSSIIDYFGNHFLRDSDIIRFTGCLHESISFDLARRYLGTATWTVIPFHLNGNHWICLLLDNLSDKLYILDSGGNTLKSVRKAVQQAMMRANEVEGDLRKFAILDEHFIPVERVYLQNDSVTCGVAVIYFMRKLRQFLGQETSMNHFDATKLDAETFRYNLQMIIAKDYFRQHENLCNWCLRDEAPDESSNSQDSWIQCTYCYRWYHITCIGLSDDVVRMHREKREQPWSCSCCTKFPLHIGE